MNERRQEGEEGRKARAQTQFLVDITFAITINRTTEWTSPRHNTMSGLVGYASSDEDEDEDDIQPSKPAKVGSY